MSPDASRKRRSLNRFFCDLQSLSNRVLQPWLSLEGIVDSQGVTLRDAICHSLETPGLTLHQKLQVRTHPTFVVYFSILLHRMGYRDIFKTQGQVAGGCSLAMTGLDKTLSISRGGHAHFPASRKDSPIQIACRKRSKCCLLECLQVQCSSALLWLRVRGTRRAPPFPWRSSQKVTAATHTTTLVPAACSESFMATWMVNFSASEAGYLYLTSLLLQLVL